ncbi:Ger(x)C family spore germination protein [Sediminibacillus albus]|uniref:Germination protein, Ger(X)C family n=1 Tax=Sediminibacillus albus TaxID=407036 RepID=A0A1G8X455_9BACI|nr:Ger(x)C family spore germination protein [Sediminibacillus albus]SDJ85127.1 germination protein, Ger(x)C family [Sediminibacillus albus]
MVKVNKMPLVIFCLFILTGCWDRNEISDINFVMGMAIDTTDEDKLRVTFQWALPTQFSTEGAKGAGSQENTDFSIEADSLTRAMSMLTEISPRTPVYSHMELIVLGEEVVQKEMENVINVIDREFEVRRTVNIVTAKGKGEDILRSKTPFETVQSTGIQKIITMSNQSSTFRDVNLNDLFIHVADPDSLAYTPVVETVAQSGLEPTETGGQNSWIQVDRVIFFDKFKKQLELSAEESKAWMYVLGKVEDRTVMEIPTDKGMLVTSSVSQKSKPTIEMNGDQPSVKYTITEKTSIMDKPIDMTKSEMEKAIEAYLSEKVTETIKKMQEENHDIFFLRKAIRQQYPQQWKKIRKNWPETYASIQFEVHTKVTIEHQNALRKDKIE